MGQDAVHGVPRLLSDDEKHGDDHEHLDIDVVLLRNYNDLVFPDLLLKW